MRDLLWVDLRRDVWRSLDGQYVIVRSVLPEDRPNPTPVYTLRRLERESVADYPGTLGHLLAESRGLAGAQLEAAHDARHRARAGEFDVPETWPALRLTRFFWPISEGTDRAALVLVRQDERLLVRVIGMALGDGDHIAAVTFAELDLTDLPGTAQPPAEPGRADGDSADESVDRRG